MSSKPDEKQQTYLPKVNNKQNEQDEIDNVDNESVQSVDVTGYQRQPVYNHDEPSTFNNQHKTRWQPKGNNYNNRRGRGRGRGRHRGRGRLNDTIKAVNLKQFVQQNKKMISGLCTISISVILHVNFNEDSIFDGYHKTICMDNTNHQYMCTLLYGFAENLLMALLLIILYYLFFYCYFRIRYHFPLSNFLFGVDAYIIAFPWLLSPILNWHSITSLIIHVSPLLDSLFFYTYPLTTSSTHEQTNSSTQIFALFVRTFFSFLLWRGFDWYLWNNESLKWLFVSGPKKAISHLTVEYQRMIYKALLVHFDGVVDVTKVCLSYCDVTNSKPKQLMHIQTSIWETLSYSNLSSLNIIFWVTLISAFRFWYCPSIVCMIALPVSIVVLVLFHFTHLFIAIVMFCNTLSCLQVCTYFSWIWSHFSWGDFSIAFRGPWIDAIGVLICCVMWGYIIWFVMWKRLEMLRKLQQPVILKILERISIRNSDLAHSSNIGPLILTLVVIVSLLCVYPFSHLICYETLK